MIVHISVSVMRLLLNIYMKSVSSRLQPTFIHFQYLRLVKIRDMEWFDLQTTNFVTIPNASSPKQS